MAESADEPSVNLVSPGGQPFNVPLSQANKALDGGYRMATPEEVSSFKNNEKYGSGNLLAAGALGAARSASFGLSDQLLTKTGLVNPETIKGIGEANPIASGLGEAAGVGAGLLAPELEGAGALLNPVKAVSKIGGAAAEALAPAAEAAAKYGSAGRIAGAALQAGAGSAVEGAFYGLGNTVSEQALGDPDLNAEKVLANVGYSALLGGALGAGVGGFAHVAGEGISAAGNRLKRIITPAEQAGVETGDIASIANVADIPPAQKEGILTGLSRKSADAGKVTDAAKLLGSEDEPLPILASMVHDDRDIAHVEDALIQGPDTWASSGIKQRANAIWEGVTNKVKAGLDAINPNVSEYQAGEAIQNSFLAKIKAQSDYFNDIYGKLKGQFDDVPLRERSINAHSRNLLADDSVVRGMKFETTRNSPQMKAIQTIAEDMKKATTVDDLMFLKSQVRANIIDVPMASAEMKRVGYMLSDRLNDAVESNLDAFIKEAGPRVSEEVRQMWSTRQVVNGEYREAMQKLKPLAEALGRKRIGGHADIAQFIDSMEPQTIARKLFNPNKIDQTRMFAQNFPEEFEVVKRHEIGDMMQKASAKGSFDVKLFLKNARKLDPEIRDLLFGKSDQKIFEAAELFLNKMPKDFNPSHTASMTDLRNFHSGPVAAAKANVRDWAMQKYVNLKTGLDTEALEKGVMQKQDVQNLGAIEKMTQTTSQKIASGAKALFTPESRDAISGYVGAKWHETYGKKKEKHADIASNLNDLGNDPQRLMDKLEKATASIQGSAPDHAQALQTKLATMTAFLQSKLPTTPQDGPLGPVYEPSPSEIAQFNTYYRAAVNPLSVLQDARNGTLTQAAMDSMMAVNPKILQEMQGQLMAGLTSHHAKTKGKMGIPYARKQSIGLLLGQDLDGSFSGKQILGNQLAIQNSAIKAANQSGGAPAGRGQGHSTQSGLGKLKQSTALMTEQQKSVQRVNRG